MQISGGEGEDEEGGASVSPRRKIKETRSASKGQIVKSVNGPLGTIKDIAESDIRIGKDIEDSVGANDISLSNKLYVSPNMRKNQTLKSLKMLEEKDLLIQQIGGIKIEEKNIRKDINVGVVSAKTIEALLRFLGIEPDDSRYQLDNKLNSARIEI